MAILIDLNDFDLEFLLLGINGNGDGQFILPVGIATDAGGNVIVTEDGGQRVQKFVSSPEVALVSDVTNDQGKQARLRVLRASADSPNSGATILRYDVYRRIDPLAAVTSQQSARPRG